jgi:sarcosine oxidase subunit alpha
MDALRLLRLEKGHILVGQDTDFDTTPSKLGLDWAVKMDKPYFVGKAALERIAHTAMAHRLVPVLFDPGKAPAEGAAVSAGEHHVGYLTSARYSPTLERGVALAWVRRVGEQFPTAVRAEGIGGSVVSGPFYDPKGDKLRA